MSTQEPIDPGAYKKPPGCDECGRCGTGGCASHLELDLSASAELRWKQTQRIKSAVASAGFSRFKPKGFDQYAKAVHEVCDAFEALPFDPNDEKQRRKRRHQRYALNPWSMTLEKRPVDYYMQLPKYNPEAGGKRRQFAQLDGGLAENPFLIDLIKADFKCLPWQPEQLKSTVDVGIHFMRYVARPSLPAVSSPPGFHEDDEPFTVIHVKDRLGIKEDSGLTEIGKMNGKGMELIARFKLTELFEAAVVTRAPIFHRVTPVEVEDGQPFGYRDAIFIDFAPMVVDRSAFELIDDEVN